MTQVKSKDGTAIAYIRGGDGPAVVLVGGGLDDGSENATLIPTLADLFTVASYARRGRGHSGDTPPYSLEREIEDLAAVIHELGGHAHAFGTSSGGALLLEAAAAGLPLDRIAVWEVPYAVGGEAVAGWQEYSAALRKALARDDRDQALELFMRLAGSPQELVAQVKESDHWPIMRELAPTLAYDAACLGDGPPPADRLRSIIQPTLVITGPGGEEAMQEMAVDFMGSSADAIVAAMPAAERRRLAEGGHMVDPAVLGPVLANWFAS
jgi:pimeloyl-ACP methyl ester carboxylesterase